MDDTDHRPISLISMMAEIDDCDNGGVGIHYGGLVSEGDVLFMNQHKPFCQTFSKSRRRQKRQLYAKRAFQVTDHDSRAHISVLEHLDELDIVNDSMCYRESVCYSDGKTIIGCIKLLAGSVTVHSADEHGVLIDT
eukprot:scaffold71750_cov42-Cyclotella_meneghiniana.AAC.2